MPTRIRVLVVCFFVYGAFNLALAIVMGLVFNTDTDGSLPVGAVTRHLLPLAMSVLAAAAIAAGVGMSRRTPWARPLAILLAFLSLLFFPIGTLFGAFALWALSSTAVSAET